MANHPNRSQISEFARTRLPADATAAEIAAAEALDASREAAVRPWRTLRNQASARVLDHERRLTNARNLVLSLRRQLIDAERDLAIAETGAAAALPQLEDTAKQSQNLYEAARRAALDAGSENKRWRLARSGKILTTDGTLCLERTDYTTQVALLA